MLGCQTTVQSSLHCETSPKRLLASVVMKGFSVLTGGCPGPSVGVNSVGRSVVRRLIQFSPCLSQRSWLSSCAVGGLRVVAVGRVVSSSAEGVALGLHISCGVRSCSFRLAGGVSVVVCGEELCRAGVVFVVIRPVGVTFLRNLVSPAQPSPSSLFCNFCLESSLAFSCSFLVLVCS